MSTAAVREYWDRVAALGCVICKMPATIAHAHGGSIVERMKEPKAKGRKLPRYDWLVIPLCPFHAYDTSPCGLDRDVDEWEYAYGTQAMYVDRISKQLGVDVWTLALETVKPIRRRSSKILPRRIAA